MPEYIIGLLALAISIWAARQARHAVREDVNHGSVSDLYVDFRRLAEIRMRHPEHTHLLEPPENYDLVRREVQGMLVDYPTHKQSEYVLRERTISLVIFQLFEQILYQHGLAVELRDERRRRFLAEVLAYMTGNLFLNPRLLFLWDRRGGNLQADFEEATRVYYDKNVTRLDRDRRMDPLPAFRRGEQ